LVVQEEFLHFLWQFRLFGPGPWLTEEGETVEVIKPGLLNRDSGPDFSEARIRIGEAEWVGHVEFHLRTSDWARHGHDSDPAYDNVILHVVAENDVPPPHRFPTLVLGPMIPGQYLENWQELRDSRTKIPCAGRVGEVDGFVLSNWVERLAIERMERKALDIIRLGTEAGGDLRHSFYLTLFRYFGFKVNNDAFEALARSIPMIALEKHCDSLMRTEALLYGQAGFLECEPADDYHATLQREYRVLRSKFSLIPMEVKRWKFMRLMPSNFPTVRIAQLAALIHGRHGIYSKIMMSENGEDLAPFFQNPVSDYWTRHYRFGKAFSRPVTGRLGQTAVDLLLINVAAPFKFAYGKLNGKQDQTDGAMRILETVRAEQNAITRDRKALGFPLQNALDSQGIIELSGYCKSKRCLQCAVGQSLIRNRE
jgi:hypothetical protein